MFKTGIYTLAQLNNDITQSKCSEKRVSITLLEEAKASSNAKALTERILLTFTDERGAYKRTYADRFLEFDNNLLPIIKEHFDVNTKLCVHDVAVSDGRTAVDFYKKLQEFTDLEYTASDYSSKVSVLADKYGKVTIGADNQIIEVVFAPFVFNFRRPDRYWRAPLNRILQYILKYTYVPYILSKYKTGTLSANEIFLMGEDTLLLAAKDMRFNLEQYDLLQPFKKSYDIIRAMNVLNTSYFTKDEFTQILQNIHAGLNDKGLFIHGSNQNADSIVNGGIYKKTNQGFELLHSSGDGSHLANLLRKPIRRLYD